MLAFMCARVWCVSMRLCVPLYVPMVTPVHVRVRGCVSVVCCLYCCTSHTSTITIETDWDRPLFAWHSKHPKSGVTFAADIATTTSNKYGLRVVAVQCRCACSSVFSFHLALSRLPVLQWKRLQGRRRCHLHVGVVWYPPLPTRFDPARRVHVVGDGVL